MNQGKSFKDASHLYEVERRAEHAARPGFRIMELQLSPTQKVACFDKAIAHGSEHETDGEHRDNQCQ